MLIRMNGLLRFPMMCGAALLLAACGPMSRSVIVQPADASGAAPVAPRHGGSPAASYRVVHGDTLYAIAFRNGVDFRDLAAWNRIAPPYTIWPGQLLRLGPSASAAPTAPHVAAAPLPASAHPAGGHAAGARIPAPHAVPPPAAPAFEPVAPPSVATTPAGATHPQAAASTSVVPVAGVPDAGKPLPPPAIPPVGSSRAVGGINWRWPASGVLIKRFQAGDAIPGIELAGKSGDPVRAAADGVVVYSGNGLVGYGELIIVKHSDSFLSAYGHNRKRLVKEGQRVSAGQQIAEMGSTGASRDELQFQIRLNGNPVDPLAYLPVR
jgi:lipoprotein NlpD